MGQGIYFEYFKIQDGGQNPRWRPFYAVHQKTKNPYLPTLFFVSMESETEKSLKNKNPYRPTLFCWDTVTGTVNLRGKKTKNPYLPTLFFVSMESETEILFHLALYGKQTW